MPRVMGRRGSPVARLPVWREDEPQRACSAAAPGPRFQEWGDCASGREKRHRPLAQGRMSGGSCGQFACYQCCEKLPRVPPPGCSHAFFIRPRDAQLPRHRGEPEDLRPSYKMCVGSDRAQERTLGPREVAALGLTCLTGLSGDLPGPLICAGVGGTP